MAGASDRGCLRESNEDAFFVAPASNVMVISDGMGGQQSGEVASQIVVETLAQQLTNHNLEALECRPESVAELLLRFIREVSNLVLQKGQEHLQLHGMGATVVVGYVVEQFLVLAHLGDSRAYLLRGSQLERLTSDHTVAELLLELGAINSRQFQKHPARHQLRKFAGMSADLTPDVGILELRSGDRLLFCTDGLTCMVSEQSIGQTLYDAQTPEDACCRLIRLANEAGGKDNITVVIAEVSNDGVAIDRPFKKVRVVGSVGKSLHSSVLPEPVRDDERIQMQE